MARKPYRALADIDAKALASFQAGIRKRYSDEQILEELTASAKRLARSPTMLPIPGTSSPEHLEENWKARTLLLSTDEISRISAARN